MARARARRLKEFCERRAGQHLRGVFVYGDDDTEVVFLRDDVRRAYPEGRFATLGEAAWRVHRAAARVESTGSALGGLKGHVHTFENAFVLQFPLDDDGGVTVSFDREVGGQLAGFIDECWATLEA